MLKKWLISVKEEKLVFPDLVEVCEIEKKQK